MTTLHDAVQSYAARGWHICPLHTVDGRGQCSCGKRACAAAGKHPRWHSQLLPHGLKSASADPGGITAWWRQWPLASIGIRTGAVSGLLVLDIDPRNGGDESLAALERTHRPLPTTPRALTGGGGEHYYLAHPGGHWPNAKPALGIDLKGDGGYVVAPPSRHRSGRPYAWDLGAHPEETPLAAPPAWLLALCRYGQAQGGPAPPVGTLIGSGERNVVLTSLAGTLRRRGLDEEEVYGALWIVNQRRCVPPLEEDEVRMIAQNMQHYRPAAPLASLRARTGQLGGVPI